MAEFLTASVEIDVNKDKALAELKKVETGFKTATTRMANFVKKLGSAFKSAFTKMRRIAKWAILGMIGFFTLAVREAIKYEDSVARIEQVIKSTGGAAGVTTKQLLDMADALQSVTQFSNTSIQESQALLLTFTKIGDEIYERTLTAVLDMSVAMNQDLKSSVIQVGKALNDPIVGLTALSRVGVKFTDDQKEMIKLFVESGDVLSAQKVLLRELETEFEGQATATDTAKKSVLQMKNAFSDWIRQIGEELLPLVKTSAEKLKMWFEDNEDKARAFGKRLAEIVERFSSFVKLLGTDQSSFFSKLGDGLLESLKWIGKQLWAILAPVFTELADLFVDSIKEAIRNSPIVKAALMVGGGVAGMLLANAPDINDSEEKRFNRLFKEIGERQSRIGGLSFLGEKRTDERKPVTKQDLIDRGLLVETGKRTMPRGVTSGGEFMSVRDAMKKREEQIDMEKFSRLKEMEDRVSSEEAFGEAMEKAATERLKRIRDEERKAEAARKKEARDTFTRLNSIRTIYEDLGESTQEYLNAQKELIDIQGESFIQLGVGVDLVERWKDAEFQKVTMQNSRALEEFKGVIQDSTSSLSNFFNDGITGLNSFSQAFANMTQSIMNSMNRMISNLIAEWIMFTATTGLFGQSGAASLGMSNPFGAASLSGIGGLFGGLFGGGGSTFTNDMAVMGAPAGMAKGGITSGITIAGEAGPEGIVPLPDGRHIPVELKNGGGSNVEVNVINQTSNKVEAEQGETFFDGSKLVTEIVLKDLNSNGPIRQTMGTLQG